MINVLIADDQNFVRKTLESYLEAESDLNTVGFADNGEAAIDQVAQLQPDIVLMDIEMPIMDGLTATKVIAQRFSQTKVLILSIYDREQDVARALKLGAKGYWLKNTTAQELADAIRYVHKGYFQVALELVEKHFTLSQSSNSQVKQDWEISHKLNMVDTVLAQLEQKIGSLENLTPDNLSDTVESLVQQEISIRRDRDANLQFKLDRLSHQYKHLKQQTNLAIKTQLIVNIVLLISIVILGYLVIAN